MLKNLKNESLQILILAVPFCAVALLWDKLPDWVPIHWNARGQIDGYARKPFGTLFLPALNIGIALLISVLAFVDPKFRKHGTDAKASLWRTVKIIRLLTTGFLSLTSLATLAAALGFFRNGAQFSYLMYAGIAVLYIFLGNLMTKLRPNYFVGIRTPWTLESKEVWMKTHRVGGRLMIFSGFLMLLLCFVVPLEQYVFWVVLPISALLALFSFLYSYVIYKKQESTPTASA
jgi:uncharacterized membrane protein